MARRKNKSSTAASSIASVPAASDQSAAPSFFEKLPPEIRNAIYELSYTPDKPLKVKPTRPTRSVRRDVSFEKSSAQLCVLNRLMVSRQWLEEVVKIFAGCTTFDFDSFPDMVKVVRSLPSYLQLHITTVAVRFQNPRPTDHVQRDQCDMQAVAKVLPSLKSFRATGGDYCSWQAVLRPCIAQDFESGKRYRPWISLVQSLRGLTEFRYGAGNHPMSTLAAQNIAAFEQWMLLEVTKAKGT